MSNITQYIAFGVAGGANTYSYAAYALSAQVGPGYSAGTADAQHVNTVLRQTTVGVAALAKFAADNGTEDVLDNGVVADFEVALRSAVNALIDAKQGWITGDVKATLRADTPTGWVFAEGQIVARIGTYAGLFALFGEDFGIGDGFTTFQLPDLRGQFLRGLDAGRGLDPDGGSRWLGSSQADMLEAHTHNLKVMERGIDGGDDEGDNTVRTTDAGAANYITSTGGAETRPTNVAVRFLIKL